MLHEFIGLGIFLLAALAIFSGLVRKARSGRSVAFIVAIAAAVYLVVALPPSLSPWARPHAQNRHLYMRSQAAPMAAPVTMANPPSSDSILVVALQDTFDFTKTTLSDLLRAATADQTRVVSDETVLQIIVGLALTALFAVFGLLISAIRRVFVPKTA